MHSLIVRGRDGSEARIEGQVGVSVMEILRGAGQDDILAICGGCCSCATCHVYVDDAHLDRLPPMSDDEDELLSASDHRTGRSRLSCQIRFTGELNGMTVTVAPED